MRLQDLPFRGFHEEQSPEMAETLQVLAPENDLERDLLSWTILPEAQTITDDSTREGYTFQYEIGKPVGEGLFALKLTSRDASGTTWTAEIVAALLTTTGAVETSRSRGFIPYWFINDHLHFQSDEGYPNSAFGRLKFGDVAVLPHRRLFGATV